MTGEVRQIQVSDEEIGVFVKAGSIVPRKYMRRLSALQTLNDNYLIDIYPNLRGDNVGTAKGSLYLDDGESFNHTKRNEYSFVHFIYKNDALYIQIENDGYREG